MERQQSSGPDEAPDSGDTTDVGAASVSSRQDGEAAPDLPSEADYETDPPDGTAGVSAGGAG